MAMQHKRCSGGIPVFCSSPFTGRSVEDVGVFLNILFTLSLNSRKRVRQMYTLEGIE